MTATTKFSQETRIVGCFFVPPGVLFDGPNMAEPVGKMVVSTVCTDADRDLYETSVFLDVPPKVAVFRANFAGTNAASYGHDRVVKKLLAKDLPLAIPITYLADNVVEEKHEHR